jgi:hypothetical protein
MLRFQGDAAFILTEGANLAPQVQRNPVTVFVGSLQKHLLNVRTIADPIGITEAFEEGASQLLATDLGPGRTVQQDQRVGFKGNLLDSVLQAQRLESPKRVRPELYPSPGFAELARAFVDVHFESLACQCKGGTQASNTSTNDLHG